MNYPVWDVPFIGGGVIVALLGILHVFIAQFAVGGSLFLIVTERRANKTKDEDLRAWVRSQSRFFTLIVVVFGAVTGVGIWFSIGLTTPGGTSSLLHVFLWLWAAESVVFAVEITAALVYYYGWDHLSKRRHALVGWVYAVSAWISLFMVNGILSFMLTPPGTMGATMSSTPPGLWEAFWNPSNLPSLLMRTLTSVALAGLYGLWVASGDKDRERRVKLIRQSALWVLTPFLLLPFAGIWYFRMIWAHAPLAWDMVAGGAPPVTIFLCLSILFSILICFYSYLGPYRKPKRFGSAFALLLLTLGFLVTGTSEWVREAIRKPYIIYGYMYANGILADRHIKNNLSTEGFLNAAKWAGTLTPTDHLEDDKLKRGATLFRLQCMSCHTIRGYNGIRHLVKGWRLESCKDAIRTLDERKGFMPPFIGTDFGTEGELTDLATWLREQGLTSTFEGSSPPHSPNSRGGN